MILVFQKFGLRGVFLFQKNMEEKEKELEKRELLLQIFRESGSITVTNACKAAGVARQTFYYFQETDPNFKLEILKIKQEKLSAQIATAV